MGTFEDHLRQKMINDFGSVAKFAERADVPKTTVYNILQRGIGGTSLEIVNKIYSALDLDWADPRYQNIYDGISVDCRAAEPETVKRTIIRAPLYGRIAAGKPIEMEAVEDYLDISRSLSNRYPEAFFLRVDGESMNRVLPNGSFALIDPSIKNENVVNGHIYALCINGHDATIKTVKKLANGYALIPDSNDPTYKPQVFDYGVEGTDKITIIGQVVWYMVPPDFLSNYRYEVIEF